MGRRVSGAKRKTKPLLIKCPGCRCEVKVGRKQRTCPYCGMVLIGQATEDYQRLSERVTRSD